MGHKTPKVKVAVRKRPRNSVFLFFSLLCFIFSVLIFWSSVTYGAIVPGQLSYQGKLTDSNGTPLNGPVKIV